MNINSNRWNRLRYSLWAPLYDLVGRRFDGQRRESLALLDVKPAERVLVVGAGTGADLPYLPDGCRVVATDLTLAMLTKARPRLRAGVSLAIMDGHQLAVGNARFDAVVLHLIVAVIPDPVRCLQEVARVLVRGGRVVVFDKFIGSGRVPLALRLLNPIVRTLFTDVTRNLEDILGRSGGGLTVERDVPALFGGRFRRILLRKVE